MIKRDSTIISGQGGLSGAEKPFDAMNNIVANLLLNITRYSVTLCSYTVDRVCLKNLSQNVYFITGHAPIIFFTVFLSLYFEAILFLNLFVYIYFRMFWC